MSADELVLNELRAIRELLEKGPKQVLSTEEAAAHTGCQSVDAFYHWSRRVHYKATSNGRHHVEMLDACLDRERRLFETSHVRKVRRPRGRTKATTL